MSHIFSGESEDSGSDLESLKHFDRKSILCQVSSKSVRKWTIYTANAGPTDLLESPPPFNRKFILCQVSSKSVREWTIYTANARPTDFLESPTTFDRKYIFCQVSSNILRKWTIYTANAGPTDLPESQNRKFLKSAEPAPPIGPPVRTPRDPPDNGASWFGFC